MKFQEFMTKSKVEGFRGLPAIDGRDPKPGKEKTITLSWCGTNNDMWKASEFGFHEVGPVNLVIAAKMFADAVGNRLQYSVEDA